MIQRVQSILMLLAALCLGGLFLLPFASSASTDATIFSDNMFTIHDKLALVILSSLGALIAFISIFIYSNRKLQMKINVLGILLSGAIFGLALGIQHKTSLGNYEAGYILPIVSFILLLAANYFIGKDEKTVRSMDRLR